MSMLQQPALQRPRIKPMLCFELDMSRHSAHLKRLQLLDLRLEEMFRMHTDALLTHVSI